MGRAGHVTPEFVIESPAEVIGEGPVLGFVPQFSIEDAVRDLALAFRQEKISDSMSDDWYYNIWTMKRLCAK